LPHALPGKTGAIDLARQILKAFVVIGSDGGPLSPEMMIELMPV